MSRAGYLRSISCRGKMRIPEREVAATLGKFRKKYADKSLTAYKCEFCSLWHIGHRRQP